MYLRNMESYINKKLKKLIILALLIIIVGILILTCNFNKKSIEFSLPYNISVLDLIDNENAYILKNNDGYIYIYNFKKETYKTFLKPKLANSKIVSMKISKQWLVWVEQSGNNSILFAQNRNTNNVLKIYESQNQIIGLQGNKLLYCKYDSDNIYSVLRNLNDDTEIILDQKDSSSKYNISIPYIYNNTIVWSKSIYDNISGKLISNVFLYDINTQKKQIISANSSIEKPIIENNIIIATNLDDNKSYTKTSLVVYNNKKENWNKLVSQDSSIYKNKKYVSIDNPILDGNLLSWWDNHSKDMYLYDFSSNSFKTIETNKQTTIGSIYLIKDNWIFFKAKDDADAIKIHKCIYFGNTK